MISNPKISQSQAAALYMTIFNMGGSEELMNRRAAIQDRLKNTWPEILDPEVSKEIAEGRGVRAFPVDEFDKRVVGEGMRALLKKPNANGMDFATCCEIADSICIGKWFRTVTAKTPIEPFDGQSDDEPALDDDLKA